MRIGRDTKRRVDAIKDEIEESLRHLDMCVARLDEHAGTKKMVVPLKNAVDKIRRWKNAQHYR